jgi:hypothetical protein
MNDYVDFTVAGSASESDSVDIRSTFDGMDDRMLWLAFVFPDTLAANTEAVRFVWTPTGGTDELLVTLGGEILTVTVQADMSEYTDGGETANGWIVGLELYKAGFLASLPGTVKLVYVDSSGAAVTQSAHTVRVYPVRV